MNNLLVIYHGGCDDGFGAAWAVHRKLCDIRGDSSMNVEFHYGDYKEPPPDVTGRDVLLVDFSYKRPTLEMMTEKANSLLVLDHHKTAAADLAFLPPAPANFDLWLATKPKVSALFDMDRSGAGITWDYLHAEKRPMLINYLEDRDLWKKKLPNSDEFTMALRSYPQEFAVWDGLSVYELIAEGHAIKRYYRLRVEEFKKAAYVATLGGHLCLVANAPYFAASEVAGELAEVATFGACYFEEGDGLFRYSLRSRGDFDVSEIAKQYGGGGHKNAAGFNLKYQAHRAESV